MSAGDYAKGAKLAGKAMRAAPEKPEYAVLYGFALFENDEDLYEPLFFDGGHPTAEGFVVFTDAVVAFLTAQGLPRR